MNTVNEIKVRNMMRHVRAIATIGPRPDGTEADHEAIRYIKRELEAVGVAVGSLPLEVPVVDNLTVSLEILGEKSYQIPCRPLLRAGLTPKDGIVAPLAFVGKALEQDFKNADIKGKIVFCYEDLPFEGPTPEECNFPATKTGNAFKAGAVGLIFSTRRKDSSVLSKPGDCSARSM